MSYRIEPANKTIKMKDGMMICIECVETSYEHLDHISWLAGQPIKYNTLKNFSERTTRLLKNQEVSPFRFKLTLEIHLSISHRNAASYGINRT